LKLSWKKELEEIRNELEEISKRLRDLENSIWTAWEGCAICSCS